jgi:cell division protein ZapA (FtsZ GTPase activity inhibitor)
MSDEVSEGADVSMDHSPVVVDIAGHEYKIRSDGDPDALREIAGYVDRAMARVRDRTGTVDTLDVAVLTSLNLAREILSLREERTPQGSTAVDGEKLRDLIGRVEAASGSDTSGGVDERTSGSREAGAAQEGRQSARTLELPSVEALRERAAAADAPDDSELSSEVAEPRAASGGRDRAS